ncbi:MAG: CYTH domain-containing protein [Parcubacteria group bacterium]
MIEIEKKFQLNQEQFARLLEDAEKLSEKRFTDTYYDSVSWRLTTRDTWLRSRDGAFELKVPLDKRGVDDTVDKYHEITDELQIRKVLKLARAGTLEQALAQAALKPFATITTLRKKYRHGEFAIDVDEADFGYNVVEIELEAPTLSDIDRVTAEILDFARSKGLEVKKLNGKVCEYIERNNPDHYEALVKAGVFGDFVWHRKPTAAKSARAV